VSIADEQESGTGCAIFSFSIRNLKMEVNMYKKLFAFIMIAGLCCATALAQEQKGPSLSDWLKGIQKKINKIVPKKALPQSTAVAGTRGAKEDSSAKLYWKGKKGEEQVTEEEMTEFRAAIELITQGERDVAIKGLEKFMAQYPDSALIPDAKKTLDLVKAEPMAEKKAEPKEEKTEEKKDDKKE